MIFFKLKYQQKAKLNENYFSEYMFQVAGLSVHDSLRNYIHRFEKRFQEKRV